VWTFLILESNSELEEKRHLDDLAQGLGGAEFSINLMTAQYCSAADLSR